MLAEVNAEQYVLNLISVINANQQFLLTKKAIILTSLSQNQIDPPFLPKLIKKQVKPECLPQLSFASKQQNISIINTRNYLFENPSNGYPCCSAINFLYLLTFYSQTTVLVLFKAEHFKNENKQQVITMLNNLGQLLGESDQSKQFWKHFIFGIYGQNQNGINFQKQMKQKVLGSLGNRVSKQILKYLIANERVIDLCNVKLPESLISEISTLDNGYDSSPHILTKLYSKVLSENQLRLLKKQIVQSPSSPHNNFGKMIEDICQAIENREIFLQDNEDRTNALYEQIISVSPLSHLAEKAKKQIPQQKMRIPQQYAIQAAFFILMQIYKTENQLADHYSDNDYLEYNCTIHSVWDHQLPNKSIMAELLTNIFSSHTIIYKHEMFALANYLQVYFQVFQNVPQLKIREKQLKVFKILQNDIIQKFVEFFYETIDYRINKQLFLTNIHPNQILRLTGFVKRLINLLEEMIAKRRAPFESLAQDFSFKAIYIASIYFFVAWKCYEKYSKFWSKYQLNHFMVELYNLCRNKKYFDSLQQNHQQKKPNSIIKKLNQYFGKINFEKKQYYFASKFYQAALLNYNLIQTYEQWLQNMYTTNQLNYKDIKNGIKKLADLGLIEKSRIWCYKFMEIVENNSQIISILEDLIEDFKHDNRNMMEEINKMKQNKISIVNEEIMNEVSKQLIFEEWLPIFQDY